MVLRLPLATLATGGSLQYNFFQSSNFSLRCTQGAGGVMYFASHNSLQQIRVFAWPEATDQISQFDIDVAPWTAGQYSAPCTDGSDWMRRCDSRMTAGYLASGELGFMWTANSRADRPFPYVRVVRLREAATPTLLGQTDIFNSNYAYAYPDASPNSAGEIGIALYRGGGAQMPGHVVGVMNRANGQWSLSATRDGTNGPADHKWGDYLTCPPRLDEHRALGGRRLHAAGRRRAQQRRAPLRAVQRLIASADGLGPTASEEFGAAARTGTLVQRAPRPEVIRGHRRLPALTLARVPRWSHAVPAASCCTPRTICRMGARHDRKP